MGDGEPFYSETLGCAENLRRAGVRAEVDVYRCDVHAFDMLRPGWALSRRAIERFDEQIAAGALARKGGERRSSR